MRGEVAVPSNCSRAVERRHQVISGWNRPKDRLVRITPFGDEQLTKRPREFYDEANRILTELVHTRDR